MDEAYTKLPRLYIDPDLECGKSLSLDDEAVHYFKNVLRRQVGDLFRAFNGRDSEWLAEIQALGKKRGTALIMQKIKDQPPPAALHLIFTPLKKRRMDMIIEKAVELGVSDFHPVLTHRTEVRKINKKRLEAQIIEAAEQCERLSIPTLHPIQPLERLLSHWDRHVALYACLERSGAKPLGALQIKSPAAFLIGPVGGFDDDEILALTGQADITPICLGEAILRCETAALTCLSYYKIQLNT